MILLQIFQDGITALHLACAFAREDTVRLLLTRKADPLIPGGVIKINHLQFIQILSNFINAQPKKQLPIHVLAMKPTGAAVVPLQLILKSCPREVRLAPDGVSSHKKAFKILLDIIH